MGRCAAILVALLAIVVGTAFFIYTLQPPEPPAMKDGWFGTGKLKPDDPSIKEFQVNVPESVLKDLSVRLNNTRLVPELEGSMFEYGFRSGYLKEVLDYWKDKYDWRKHEKILNSFKQFKTQIEGINIHYIREKPQTETSRVLLLVHGWPGSVWEFHKIIPMLNDPTKYGGSKEDSFEVIAPSIPGYAFSDAPKQKGFDIISAAHIFHKLMTRLGVDHYYVQGGDWGSDIVTIMSQAYPQHITGCHLNMFMAPFNGMALLHQVAAWLLPSVFLDGEAEQQKWQDVGGKFVYFIEESGYMHIQATKPDTVGVGLNDSPAGLAAYILEKFSTWTNPDYKKLHNAGLTEKFTLDDLLTNVMIYWVTGSITSSQRLYKEYNYDDAAKWDKVPVTVPTALAYFPHELFSMPFTFAEYRYVNTIQTTDMPRGGHFAAFEEPELLAQDIQDFVRKIETKPN